MQVGLVGKPSAGKSTFFTAATAAVAEIADYPFTTIASNRGVGHVRRPCPCRDLGVTCNPQNSLCRHGTRYLPVEMVDVAGLVPGAHEGRGMGNQFLDDLRQADALIQIVDASGRTDLEGNATEGADPLAEVAFLADEVHRWLAAIVLRNWQRASRAVEAGQSLLPFLAERLAGLGFTEAHVSAALRETQPPESATAWTEDDGLALARALQRIGKPFLIAANKADIAPPENLAALREADGAASATTVSADYEMALRNADRAGLVAYRPGDGTFEITAPDKLSAPQSAALATMRAYLEAHGTTGVQKCLEAAVLQRLDRIAAYPVEDETHYADSKGNVLPDGYLLPRGATARDLAYKVHSDIGDGLIRAIDCRTKRIIGRDHVLKDGAVVKIVAG